MTISMHMSKTCLASVGHWKWFLGKNAVEMSLARSVHQPHILERYNRTQSTHLENEQKISNLLDEIEKWIMGNLHSDQTLEKFEMTKEQLEQIKKEREKTFDSIK